MPTYVAGDDNKDANYELFLGGRWGGDCHMFSWFKILWYQWRGESNLDLSILIDDT